MPEYTWLYLFKQDFEYAWGSKCQGSEYGGFLNMWAFYSILNMAEYALTDFWIYFGF